MLSFLPDIIYCRPIVIRGGTLGSATAAAWRCQCSHLLIVAAPTLEDDEKCEHGHKFSHELLPTNIESTNMQIHHTTDTKDSRRSSLVLMFLRTEGCVCECKKHFTGEPTIIVDIDNKSVLFTINHHKNVDIFLPFPISPTTHELWHKSKCMLMQPQR